MIAAVHFTGVVGGKDVQFSPGDKITPAVAKELGLKDKPDLVTMEKTDKD